MDLGSLHYFPNSVGWNKMGSYSYPTKHLRKKEMKERMGEKGPFWIRIWKQYIKYNNTEKDLGLVWVTQTFSGCNYPSIHVQTMFTVIPPVNTTYTILNANLLYRPNNYTVYKWYVYIHVLIS